MVMLKESSCRVCPKIFCCSDCRNVHESRKHPKPRCPLCLRRDLLFKWPHKTDEPDKQRELICHIGCTHLPLHCKLCGDKYTSTQELLEAKPCRWRTKISKAHCLKPLDSPSTPTLDDSAHSVISHLTTDTEPSSVIAATSIATTISACSSDLELTDCVDKKIPTTPRILLAIDTPADTSAISRVKQDPSNFDSPPELARQTSTPVHGLGLANYHHQKQTNVAAIPQFVLKTPSSSFEGKRTPTTFDGTAGSGCSRGSNGYESRYYTGLTSGICGGPLDGVSPAFDNNHNNCENATEADPSWNSPAYSILKKDDHKKDQQDQNFEKNLIKHDAIDRINESIISKDNSEKRVRFSDQCVPPPPPPVPKTTMQEAPTDSSAYFANNDIFFEARESLGEDSNESRDMKRKEDRIEEVKCETCACCSRNKGKDSSPTLSAVDCNNNNKNNNNNEMKIEKKIQSPADSSVGDNSKVNTSTSSTTSRVLMMVLVEKSDSKGLSSLDLGPLIDSGLKKLEETMANANHSSNADKGTSEHSAMATKLNAELSSITRRSSSFTEETTTQKNYHHHPQSSIRASVKDSFVSITDRIDCLNSSTPTRTSVPVSDELERQLSSKADSLVVEPYGKSDGIFSVMARVVRSAFKKLPAVGSVAVRNLSREPLPACLPTTSFVSPASSLSTAVSTSGSSSQLSISATSGMLAMVPPQHVLLQRSTSKRPRTDSNEDQQMPSSTSQRDSPGSSSRNEVISSPAAKRPRGWYRIRAREPIARMRERQTPVSPRGASREIQRFHQGSGSLTIGSSDTFLPLPSRAHQSTQTEEKSEEK